MAEEAGVAFIIAFALMGVYLARKPREETSVERQRKMLNALKVYTAADVPQLTGFIGLGVKHPLIPAVPGFESRGVIVNRGGVYLESLRRNEHIIIIGMTGSGKSNALQWFAHQYLEDDNPNLFVMESKGSLDFSQEMVSRIARKKKRPIPLFLLGHDEIGTRYDGFRGTGKAIYNRLAAMMSFSSMDEGDAAYYAVHQRLALKLACQSPKGAPKSIEDLYDRLGKLKEFWTLENKKADQKAYLMEKKLIASLDEKALKGLQAKVGVYYMGFHDLMGPNGFSFDTVPGAVFSFKASVAGDDITLDQFAKIEDFKGYMGNPIRQRGEPGVLAIDEYDGKAAGNIDIMFRQAREHKLSMILATQDVTLMGVTPDERKKILTSAGTLILMRTNNPEEIIELAGSKTTKKSTAQMRDGEPTGMQSIQEIKEFVVDPDEVRGLADGEAFVIRQNMAWRIRFPMAPKVEHSSDDILRLDEEGSEVVAVEELPPRRIP